MKFCKSLIILLICALLVSCGPSADKVTVLTARYQEAIALYDSTAPIVSKLTDADVEKYEEAGKAVRKAKRAVEAQFDEYDNSEMDELLVEVENAILILRSFEGREPVKPVIKEENGTVFNIKFINHSGISFNKVLLKSGSGGNDIKLEYSAGLGHEANAVEKIQAPESESFTVTGIGQNGEETAFGGSFYLSAVSEVTLTNDEGKYIITTQYNE